MNKTSMRKLIKTVLNKIDHYYEITESDLNLIEMTFLFDSNMNDIYSCDPYSEERGFFMVDREKFQNIIIQCIRSSKKAVNNVKKCSLIDAEKESIDDMFEVCSSNIAFQIVILFYFYFQKLGDMPEDVESCIDAYSMKWKGCAIDNDKKKQLVKEFIQYKKEVNNK